MPRIAPDGGYGFGAKRAYRRNIWATFRDQLKARRIPIASSHAMLMPSLEGDEIEVAMNAGFREDHLHVVDFEPAVVATLKRRYRRINTYGVSASAALQRVAQRGVRLRCANLDFCSNASTALLNELRGSALPFSYRVAGRSHDFSHPGALCDDFALVALNMLRGREQGGITSAWRHSPLDAANVSARINESSTATRHLRKEVSDFTAQIVHATDLELLSITNDFDRQRLKFTQEAMSLDWLEGTPRHHCSLIRHGQYDSSNGQTMLWSIWDVQTHPCLMAIGMVADLHRFANRQQLRGSFYGSLARSADSALAATLAARLAPLLAKLMLAFPLPYPCDADHGFEFLRNVWKQAA